MAPGPVEVVRFMARSSKRIAVSIVGGVFVAAGVAMIVLPGPGLLVIVIGFAILGTEYAWAAAALKRTKRAAGDATRIAREGVAIAGRTARGAAGSVRRRLRPRSWG